MYENSRKRTVFLLLLSLIWKSLTTVVNKCKVASILSPYVFNAKLEKSKRKEKQAG